MAAGLFAAQRLGFGLRATLVTSESGLVLPSLLAVLLAGIPLARGLGLLGVGGRVAVLSLLAGASLWMVSLGLMSLQSLLWPPPPEFLETFKNLHRALRPQGPLDAVLSVVTIAVVPAVCEEIVFRGTVLPAFARSLGGLTAVIVSAALFGAIHLDFTSGDLYRVPFTFIVGLALGALRLFTGSLVPPMLAHATLNTITFLAVLLTGAAAEATDEPSAAVALPLLALGSVLTLLLMRPLRRPVM
jgi:membrane protease YdiL (CAAX protease family)